MADEEQVGPRRVATESVDAILSELKALNRQGPVPPATLQALEARLEAQMARERQQLEASVARYKAGDPWAPPPPVLSPRQQWVVLTCLGVVVAGLLLEMVLGQRFVFAHGVAYRAALPSMFAGAALALAALLIISDRRNGRLRAYTPSWAKRWLYLIPMTSMVLAGLLVVSPLGWVATFGALLGTSNQHLPARLIDLDPPRASSRKGCGRKATVVLSAQASSSVCMDGILVDTGQKSGDSVTVTGSTSALGILIAEIRTAP